MTELTKKLEVLLFLSGEAVSKTELTEALQCTDSTLHDSISELRNAFAEHGLAITETPTHVQLATSPSVGTFVKQYIQHDALELSRAAMETLAILAYRGPMNRLEVDAIRGVDSRRMMRQLVARGLIAKTGQRGHSAQYDVTPDFLQRLGVTRREELPRWNELSSTQALEELLKVVGSEKS